MPFTRPTLKELIERTEQDAVSRLGIGTPPRHAMVRALARTEAGVAHGLYGYIDYKARNFLPDTGDDDTVLRWANLYGVQRLSAAAASGAVLATGTNGSVIPAGRVLQSSTGAQYTVDSDATISAGSAVVAVTAADGGAAGNLDAGASLSFASPVAGVVATVAVQAPGLTGGSDQETIEALRVRVMDRMRQPPKGGTNSDYVEWAKAGHPDVTRVWVAGQEMSANSVTVRIVTDNAPGGLIPTQTVIDAVLAYIQTQRPVTAEVYVVAPTAIDLDLSIAISPNTQAVKDAITAELQDLLLREAEPGGTILLSHIREAISIAAGEGDSVVISPTADVEHEIGEIAVLGDITWSEL